MKLYALPDGSAVTEDQMKRILANKLFKPQDYKARFGGLSALDIIRILESKGVPAFDILYADALQSVFDNDLGDYGIYEVIVPDEKKTKSRRRR
mgnify:CR=1 FL=1